jgi:FkbM family methyltransferase
MRSKSVKNATQTDYFVDRRAIQVKEYIEESRISCRVERKFRTVVLRERNPDCTLMKRFARTRVMENGLARITVKVPKADRYLYFRPETSDESVVRQVFQAWQYDFARFRRWPSIQRFLEVHHLRGRRPLIIDGGANIGASFVFFAMTFPTALVVAIEPEDHNFDLLSKNTQGLNGSCIRAALASEPGSALVIDSGEGSWAFRTQKLKSENGLPCVTLNSLYDRMVSEEVFPFIVKIDIEGAEQELFSRNTDWIRDTPIIIIELHDWLLPAQGIALPFLRCISGLNRDFVHVGENIFSIDNAI